MGDLTKNAGGLDVFGLVEDHDIGNGIVDFRSRKAMELSPEQIHQLHSDTELEEHSYYFNEPQERLKTLPSLRRTISNPRPYFATPQTSPEQHRRNRSIDTLESPMTPPTLLKLRAKIPSLRRKEKGRGTFMVGAPPRPERPESLRLEEILHSTEMAETLPRTGASEAVSESNPSPGKQKRRTQKPRPLNLDQEQLLNVRRHSIMSPITPGSAMIPIAHESPTFASTFSTPPFGRIERRSGIRGGERIFLPDTVPEATVVPNYHRANPLEIHPAFRPSHLVRWERVIHLGRAVPGPRIPTRGAAASATTSSSAVIYHIPTTLHDGRRLPRVCDSPPACLSDHGKEAWYLPAPPSTFRSWAETSGSSPDSGVSTGDDLLAAAYNNIPSPAVVCRGDPSTWPPGLFASMMNSYFSSCEEGARLAAAPFVDRAGDGEWYLHVPKSRSDSAVGFGPPLPVDSSWLEEAVMHKDSDGGVNTAGIIRKRSASTPLATERGMSPLIPHDR